MMQFFRLKVLFLFTLTILSEIFDGAATGCTSPGQFQCHGSSRCVPRTYLCDGDNDCGDNSDEADCQHIGCTSPEQFQCQGTPRCVPRTYLCDGDNDCGDNSDEADCPTACSPTAEFKCRTTPRCVPTSYLCDGDNDCRDNSDEADCQHIEQFQCHSASSRIQLSLVCNGNNDCDDNSDELNCRTERIEDENFLLVVDRGRGKLIQIGTDSGDMVSVLPTTSGVPLAVAYDELNRVVYWASAHSQTQQSQHVLVLGRYSLSESGSTVRHFHSYVSPVLIEELAVDPVHGKLYYSVDLNVTGKISEISVDGSNPRDVIVRRGSKPRAVVVDRVNRFLYWGDWGTTSSIRRINLVSLQDERAIISDNIVWPNALDIDFTGGVMYWGDARLGRVEMARLDGSGRQLLYLNFDDHFYGLALSPQYIYLTDWTKHAVRRIDRQSRTISDQPPRLFDLRKLYAVVYCPALGRPVSRATTTTTVITPRREIPTSRRRTTIKLTTTTSRPTTMSTSTTTTTLSPSSTTTSRTSTVSSASSSASSTATSSSPAAPRRDAITIDAHKTSTSSSTERQLQTSTAVNAPSPQLPLSERTIIILGSIGVLTLIIVVIVITVGVAAVSKRRNSRRSRSIRSGLAMSTLGSGQSPSSNSNYDKLMSPTYASSGVVNTYETMIHPHRGLTLQPSATSGDYMRPIGDGVGQYNDSMYDYIHTAEYYDDAN